MRKVLIPTDFSEVSENALKYGLDLYRRTKSTIDVVHVYHPAYDPGQTELIDVSSGVENLLKDNMAELLRKVSIFDIDVNGKVELGFVTEKIVKLSFNYDIIVMGTTGSNSLLGKIFGSVSSDVATQAHCPVLLVPPKIRFSGLTNIVYSCDFDGVNNDVLSEIISFANRYKAKLHFVHIKENDNEFKLDLPKEVEADYSIDEIEADSVINGVNGFIEKTNAELVIMATKQRSFWEKIVHTNHTKEFALNVKVPLLVYHETNR